jgi:hypothetical protein
VHSVWVENLAPYPRNLRGFGIDLFRLLFADRKPLRASLICLLLRLHPDQLISASFVGEDYLPEIRSRQSVAHLYFDGGTSFSAGQGVTLGRLSVTTI